MQHIFENKLKKFVVNQIELEGEFNGPKEGYPGPVQPYYFKTSPKPILFVV